MNLQAMMSKAKKKPKTAVNIPMRLFEATTVVDDRLCSADVNFWRQQAGLYKMSDRKRRAPAPVAQAGAREPKKERKRPESDTDSSSSSDSESEVSDSDDERDVSEEARRRRYEIIIGGLVGRIRGYTGFHMFVPPIRLQHALATIASCGKFHPKEWSIPVTRELQWEASAGLLELLRCFPRVQAVKVDGAQGLAVREDAAVWTPMIAEVPLKDFYDAREGTAMDAACTLGRCVGSLLRTVQSAWRGMFRSDGSQLLVKPGDLEAGGEFLEPYFALVLEVLEQDTRACLRAAATRKGEVSAGKLLEMGLLWRCVSEMNARGFDAEKGFVESFIDSPTLGGGRGKTRTLFKVLLEVVILATECLSRESGVAQLKRADRAFDDAREGDPDADSEDESDDEDLSAEEAAPLSDVSRAKTLAERLLRLLVEHMGAMEECRFFTTQSEEGLGRKVANMRLQIDANIAHQLFLPGRPTTLETWRAVFGCVGLAGVPRAAAALWAMRRAKRSAEDRKMCSSLIDLEEALAGAMDWEGASEAAATHLRDCLNYMAYDAGYNKGPTYILGEEGVVWMTAQLCLAADAAQHSPIRKVAEQCREMILGGFIDGKVAEIWKEARKLGKSPATERGASALAAARLSLTNVRQHMERTKKTPVLSID
ncbi:unnamed protein product [Pedinophyceae sp. YPF-701]|nr:unnamed protein product [Pedinophyceae sp. YPF-701]